MRYTHRSPSEHRQKTIRIASEGHGFIDGETHDIVACEIDRISAHQIDQR